MNLKQGVSIPQPKKFERPPFAESQTKQRKARPLFKCNLSETKPNKRIELENRIELKNFTNLKLVV